MKRYVQSFTFCLVLLLFASHLFGGIVVKGELTHEKSALQGEMYEGVINLSNDGDELREVQVYQTDYRFTCEGQNFYDDPGSHSRSNTAWIQFSPKRVSVPPGGNGVVSYKVFVPNNQTLNGTYWSMLMVEEVSNTELDPLKERTVGITTKIRYGIQLVTHLDKTGTPDLNFIDVKLLSGENGPILQVDLENRGDRWAKPVVWIDLVNSAGKKMARHLSDEKRIFPGTSVRHSIDLSGVPYDSYKALLIVDGGEDALVGKELNLNILRK